MLVSLLPVDTVKTALEHVYYDHPTASAPQFMCADSRVAMVGHAAVQLGTDRFALVGPADDTTSEAWPEICDWLADITGPGEFVVSDSWTVEGGVLGCYLERAAVHAG